MARRPSASAPPWAWRSALRRSTATGTKQFATEFQRNCDLLAATRPTAVNLFWAIERMKQAFAEGALAGESVDAVEGAAPSRRRCASTTMTWRAAGRLAVTAPRSCRDEARILTHCNAGALATAGYGTALGVIRGAVEAGKQRHRLRRRDAPVPAGRAAHRVGTGQGRHRHDGDHRQHGRRHHARWGRSTWSSSAPTASPPTATPRTRSAPTPWRCSRREHGIPFYVAAPWSTIDLATPDGAAIPIEERNAREVTHVGTTAGRRPTARRIRNPSFDVTPHRYITGIITERGIFRAPFAESLRQSAPDARDTRALMRVLGIETSCDETAAAIVERTGDAAAPWAMRSNVVASQVEIHREWGGVVPELASRQHVRDICGVVERALTDAGDRLAARSMRWP